MIKNTTEKYERFSLIFSNKLLNFLHYSLEKNLCYSSISTKAVRCGFKNNLCTYYNISSSFSNLTTNKAPTGKPVTTIGELKMNNFDYAVIK